MATKHSLDEFFLQEKRTEYNKHDIILCPEDATESVYYIEKGHVKVYSLTENGDEKLHIIYKAHELFPLLWVFDNIPISKYYEALDAVILRKSSRKDLLAFLQRQPEALFEVTQRIISILDVFTDRVENLEFTSASARLMSRLLYLAKRFGQHQGSAVLIAVPITHKDIAASIAMTRETASREFEKLVKKGLVGYVGHIITIHNIKLLEDELSTHFQEKME